VNCLGQIQKINPSHSDVVESHTDLNKADADSNSDSELKSPRAPDSRQAFAMSSKIRSATRATGLRSIRLASRLFSYDSSQSTLPSRISSHTVAEVMQLYLPPNSTTDQCSRLQKKNAKRSKKSSKNRHIEAYAEVSESESDADVSITSTSHLSSTISESRGSSFSKSAGSTHNPLRKRKSISMAR
jgi:hypothetical protein